MMKSLFEITTDEIIRLPSVPLIDRDQIPATAGIYFAVADTNEILYIGRSRHMLTRWIHHHRYEELKALGGTRIAFVVVDKPHILGGLERSLIERFKPPINDIFTSPSPDVREVSEVFEDKKVIDYLADPSGAMPIILKDAIKKFAEPVCSYCGSTDLHARNIRMEIFDAKRFEETHDFSLTGLTCTGCGAVRGGGSFHNSEKMRDALFERLTRALNRTIHLTEPFGIDAGCFHALREQLSPELFTFHNNIANEAKTKKQNKSEQATPRKPSDWI